MPDLKTIEAPLLGHSNAFIFCHALLTHKNHLKKCLLSDGGFQRSLIGMKKKLRRKKLRKSRKSRSPRKKDPFSNDIPLVTRKKLKNERFFPSFSARNTFCTSKFR